MLVMGATFFPLEYLCMGLLGSATVISKEKPLNNAKVKPKELSKWVLNKIKEVHKKVRCILKAG